MATAAKKKVAMAPRHRVFAYKFAKVYPLYVQKAERKNRTRKEVDQIICWLTGYTQAGLQKQIKGENDLAAFFAEAPAMNPKIKLIKGTVCGVRVEEVEDPLMRKMRYLDKLVDELAKGRPMEKILRQDV
ncbi:MAG: DUF2200 domain-containing protein [Pseudomonadota bacterium]